MRIVALMAGRGPNAGYRVALPLEALAARGHDVAYRDWTPGLSSPAWAQADVFYVWRLFNEPVRRIVAALRRAGVAIVWDNDDDLARTPKGSRMHNQLKAGRGQATRELAAIMRLADVVTATNRNLAARFGALSGADVRVVPNFLEPGFVRPRTERSDGEVVVGWAAGNEHRIDLKELGLRAALRRLLERNPNVRVESVNLDLGIPSERYRRRPAVAFQDLPRVIGGWDVAIAPLADVSFNRVRSDVKLKEYAGSGVPWLASPIGPYRELGEEQGGRLVADTAWAQEIERLVRDPVDRRLLGERGAAWARTQTVVEHAEAWEDVFLTAAERAARRRRLDR